MDFNKRKEYLNELSAFISQTETKLTSIFNSIGVAKQNIKCKDGAVKSTIEQRNNEELNFPEVLPTSKNFIKIGPKLQEEIIRNAIICDKPGDPQNDSKSRPVPRNLPDLHVNFSPAERLVLYNHAVEQTGHFMEPELQINLETDGSTTKPTESFIDIFNRQRDAKRRRMKYKGVKGPPLTHTQEISKLIDAHMEAYQEFLKQGLADSKSDDRRKPSIEEHKHKRRHRSRSRDSRERSKHRKHKRSRSRSRSRHKKSKYRKRND